MFILPERQQEDLRRRDERDHASWDVEVGNKIDPDDGNSLVCSACRLPIFSTPFMTYVDHDHNLTMHDQCANDLPPQLNGHPLHPKGDLILSVDDDNNNNNSCNRCHTICVGRFYKCRESYYNCRFTLDLTCALTIKILHRSHEHRLAAVRGKSYSFVCASCGTQHDHPSYTLDRYKGHAEPFDLSYVCSSCDFWIHRDCALLPNAINIDDKLHGHPLLLTYPGQGVSMAHVCDICSGQPEGMGFYACFYCRYYVHIKCVIYSNPHGFKPVLLKDAQIPDLLHLPMANENTSVMPFIRKKDVTNGGASSSISSITGTDRDDSKLLLLKVHEHPLILNEHHPLSTHDVARVCNACIQLISSTDPFYTCNFNFINNNNHNNDDDHEGQCKDFFLHTCCAHLPATLVTQHPDHDRDKGHPLTLLSKVDTYSPFNLFWCHGCWRQCNGFAYACTECNFYLDVICASMPASITHDAHGKTHILRATNFTAKSCNYCYEEKVFNLEIGYECNNCRNFRIHAKCALLPDTVTHRFDKHPLKLVTISRARIHDPDQEMFCEICEEGMSPRYGRCYGCDKCDQLFHIMCIQPLDSLSKIKFGFSICVRGHDCPLECVRALTVARYKCDHCTKTIWEAGEIAFECSKCYYKIHKECAVEILLDSWKGLGENMIEKTGRYGVTIYHY
ncbi:hypothetical protein CASFOL_020056 [Castilleja foliolosa]|uniref:Phorbol-ester/DAG-type domain-containing protein n=1 Tax=Castilleja foliolosa TaxID=1961234 RepID=A0ABD3D2I4_9LAMI